MSTIFSCNKSSLIQAWLIAFFLFSFASGASGSVALIVSKAHGKQLEMAYETAAASFVRTVSGPLKQKSQVVRFNEDQAAEAVSGIHDVIVCIGGPALLKVAEIGPDKPVVFCMAAGPRIREAVANQKAKGEKAQPFLGIELVIPFKTQFQIIRDLFPDAKRVGVIVNPRDIDLTQEGAKESAAGAGFELVVAQAQTPRDVPRSLSTLSDKADVLWSVISDSIITAQSAMAMIQFSLQERIPFIGLSETYVKGGALMSISCDYASIGEQTAGLVETLAAGSRQPPEDKIALHTPKTPIVFINKKIEKELGLSLKRKSGNYTIAYI